MRRHGDDGGRNGPTAACLCLALMVSVGWLRRLSPFRLRYYATRNTLLSVIQSFKCKDTQAVFGGRCPRRFRAFLAVAERKLAQLDAAQTLEFLRAPPGNRLEKLYGDRGGQHSIRINAQFRICFVWTDQGPAEVEIVDYH